MSPKKKNRKKPDSEPQKLDLTNFVALKTDSVAKPEKTIDSNESNLVSKSDEANPSPQASDNAATSENLTPPKVISIASPTASTQEKPERGEPASAASFEASTAAPRPAYRKPFRPESKPLQILETATNDVGEVFKSGDKILARSPWGTREAAEIVSIYQDKEGHAWAQYVPTEPVPPNWTWLGGYVRVNLLNLENQ